MQETLIKQTLQSEQFHTRLWWMEVVRGVVNIIFGIILLTHMNFTVRILIYALGIYLLIDGALDIFKIATGKRETQRKFTNYLFGFLSILLGLISFVSPVTTIIFIVAVIAVRIIIQKAFRICLMIFPQRHGVRSPSSGIQEQMGWVILVGLSSGRMAGLTRVRSRIRQGKPL